MQLGATVLQAALGSTVALLAVYVASFRSNLPAASYSYELAKMASALEGQDPEVRAGVMGGNIARLLEEVRA
jgi:hypothetical protein